MKNLGTAAAALTAAIMLGNMLTISQLQPLSLKLLGFGFALIVVVAVFLYCSTRFNKTIGWMAAIITLLVLFAVLGVFS